MAEITAREEQPGRIEAFDQITEEILADLAGQDLLREEALDLARRVIRAAARSIRATHRGNWQDVEATLGQAERDVLRLEEIALACPVLSGTGYVADAQKEYAEACITYAIVRQAPLPRPEKLHVPSAPYLNALGEAVGELRRSILDALRRDSMDLCEARLETMQQIYDFLVTVDYPDALTRGLRRTTDAVRRMLESTRADLTTALRQRTLQESLERLERHLPPL